MLALSRDPRFLTQPPPCLCFLTQRHFSIFVLSFPGADALSSIYSSILTQHLSLGNFPASMQKSTPQLINLALTFHQKIATTFLPTAIKFHYVFNLRDFANIFQVSPSALDTPEGSGLIWCFAFWVN